MIPNADKIAAEIRGVIKRCLCDSGSRFKGRVIITLDMRDGGAGNTEIHEAMKVPKDSDVLLTNNGGYVLRKL